MCKVTPIFSWLMQFLLEQRCEGSKNKMADMLGVDRQTISRAFRRTEQDNARVTPMLAEQIMLYFVELKDALDDALKKYGEHTVVEVACPMARMVKGWLEGQLQGSPDSPQHSDMMDVLENLEKSLDCSIHIAQGTGEHHGRYCRLHAKCPLVQLVEFYNRYLAELKAGAM